MIKNKESKSIEKLKKKTEKYSVLDGAFTAVKTSFGGGYIVPFGVAINATNFQISMLQSIPGLMGPISQWWSSRLIEKHSRKKVVLNSVMWEILMWLPIILLTYLFAKGILAGYIPLILIIFFSLNVMFMSVSGPAWFSWMGDIVDEKRRGNYFAKRNRTVEVIAIIATLTAAFFLDYFKGRGAEMLGFGIFFSLAIVGRLIARIFLSKQYEPKMHLEQGYYFPFKDFIKKANSNNFGKFTIFRAFFAFGQMISGPFFAIYMLRNLGFSYLTFTLVTTSAALFTIIFVKFWGKFSDKYGNFEVMKITSVLVSIIPILWIFNASPIYLILIPQLISGFGWSGFNLASSNYIYDTVTPQRRGIVVSYHNLVVGVGVFLGATLGGLIARFGSNSAFEIIFVIFIVSSFFRLFAAVFLLRRSKEVREIIHPFSEKRALKQIIYNNLHPTNIYIEPAYNIWPLKLRRWPKKKDSTTKDI